MALRLIQRVGLMVISSSSKECAAFVDMALRLIRRVGFIVNFPKSSLDLGQRFRFLDLW